MGSYTQPVTDLLNADPTFALLATGGAHNFQDAGSIGLNREQIPQAFDATTGLVKPTALVAEFPEVADGQIVDTYSQFASTVVTLVVRIYDNGSNGYGVVEQLYKRAYQLLAYQQLPGVDMFQILFKRVLKDRRDPLLKDSVFYDLYFDVYGSMSNP